MSGPARVPIHKVVPQSPTEPYPAEPYRAEQSPAELFRAEQSPTEHRTLQSPEKPEKPLGPTGAPRALEAPGVPRKTVVIGCGRLIWLGPGV